MSLRQCEETTTLMAHGFFSPHPMALVRPPRFSAFFSLIFSVASHQLRTTLNTHRSCNLGSHHVSLPSARHMHLLKWQ